MSIIFEGVDGTGKTTRAKEFPRIYTGHYDYIHNHDKTRKPVDIESEVTKEMLLMTYCDKILFDRSYIISEYIYSKVLRRETPVTLDYVKALIELINLRSHTVNLFVFKDRDKLILKDEDSKLPFIELNNAYLQLFDIDVKVERMAVVIIDDRSPI
jgi:hypothetical protein